MRAIMITDLKELDPCLDFLSQLKKWLLAYQTLQGSKEGDETLLGFIKCVDPSAQDYKMIETYFNNTLETLKSKIKSIYKISQDESRVEFNPSKLDNKKMLWHGTKNDNIPEILDAGLKICPPGVERSGGDLLGKGIYTADMSSKSLNYCEIVLDDDGHCSCLLLCEVALGRSKEVQQKNDFKETVKDFKGAITDCKSVKALGRTEPNPSLDTNFEENVIIPQGEPVLTATQASQFKHNEYAVYDDNQVRIRYLITVQEKNSDD